MIIDADLLERARELSGIREKTALVRAGLEALIAREAGKRLAAPGGTGNPTCRAFHGGGLPDAVTFDSARRHFRLDSALPAGRTGVSP